MQLARLGGVLAAIAAVAFVIAMVALLYPLRPASRTVRDRRASSAAREGATLFLFASAVPALVLLAMYALSLPDTGGHLTAGAAVRASVRMVGYQR